MKLQINVNGKCALSIESLEKTSNKNKVDSKVVVFSGGKRSNVTRKVITSGRFWHQCSFQNINPILMKSQFSN